MSGSSVLIVDDDVPWTKTAAEALRDAGYTVFLAHDGDQGAVLLTRDTPTVVIIDVHLPGVNGLELLRDFRRKDRITPVVMVSGDDQTSIQDRAMAEGASAFLRKPISLAMLLRAVSQQAKATGNGRLPGRAGERL
jgi:DNA-binding response OmpR family regulator